MFNLLRRVWAFLDHFGRAVLVWQLGGASVMAAMIGWGLSALGFIPTPFLTLLVVGAFFLSFGAVGLAAPHVLNRIPEPPALVVPQPPETASTATQPRSSSSELPMSELEASVIRNRERVFRANVQTVIDELAEARRVMVAGLNEGGYWDEDLAWGVWENVRDGFKAEKGFTAAYNATRDAYDELIAAEVMRRNRDPRNDPLLGWQANRIQRTLAAVDKANMELTRFLTREGR